MAQGETKEATSGLEKSCGAGCDDCRVENKADSAQDRLEGIKSCDEEGVGTRINVESAEEVSGYTTEEKTIEIDLRDDPDCQLAREINSSEFLPGTQTGCSKCEATIKIGQERKIEETFGAANQKAVQSPIKLIITNRNEKSTTANGLDKSEPHDRRRKSSSKSNASERAARTGHIRHIMALLALSSILLANMNRQAFNQALVRMIRRHPKMRDSVNKELNITSARPREEAPDLEGETTILYDLDESISNGLNATEGATAVTQLELPEEGFEWSGAQISLVQSAFSYGYACFMIPGGRMSEIYGAKWVVFLSSFGSALCSIMTPFLANTSFALLVASRVLMGLCQTGVSPALYALFSRWLPPEESSVYLPMIKVGVMIGFMSGSLVNGFLPWQIMFYIIGAVGLAWSAFWALFASSLPEEHKFIGLEEKKYVQYCLDRRSEVRRQEASKGAEKRNKSAPWFRIIKNPVVLAFTFTKFTVKLSTDTQTMQIPMYLRNVFQISDQLNGILNGANFAIQAIFTGVVAYTAKEMVVRENFGLHKTGIRRLFQGINCFGMSLAYLLISLNMGSLDLVCGAVILLSIASMFGAGGEAVLPVDLTTEYSASIMAIANSAANLSGIVLPPIVSFFLANQLTSSENWKHVWWFISSTMACGGLIFICFVKAKIQGFNEGKKVKQDANCETPIDKGAKTNSWMTIEMKSSRL